MNSSGRRYRALVLATLMTGALVTTGVAAAADADDRPSPLDPGTAATQRVIAALADRIDSAVSAHVGGDLRTAEIATPSLGRSIDPQSGVERRAAARIRSRASIEERAVENARVYVAIRERSASGVLVQ